MDTIILLLFSWGKLTNMNIIIESENFSIKDETDDFDPIIQGLSNQEIAINTEDTITDAITVSILGTKRITLAATV